MPPQEPPAPHAPTLRPAPWPLQLLLASLQALPWAPSLATLRPAFSSLQPTRVPHWPHHWRRRALGRYHRCWRPRRHYRGRRWPQGHRSHHWHPRRHRRWHRGRRQRPHRHRRKRRWPLGHRMHHRWPPSHSQDEHPRWSHRGHLRILRRCRTGQHRMTSSRHPTMGFRCSLPGRPHWTHPWAKPRTG
jgi:hypothetical protein